MQKSRERAARGEGAEEIDLSPEDYAILERVRGVVRPELPGKE